MKPMATTPHSPPVASARAMPRFQLALEAPRGALHPEDHGRDHRDGQDRERAAEDLLGLEAQGVGAEGQDEAEAERQTDGQADAEPQARQHVASLRANEERDEDADDQGGLETLTEPDDEGGEHARVTPLD